ncbi:MAG: HDOD domain-containing protein [Steroidobacteraceae bacterium]
MSFNTSAISQSDGEAGSNHVAVAFQFVTDLAAEVSAGRVELPAFPEVTTRVRKALTEEHVDPGHIARLVGSEAGLAARVLMLANSAALNRSGRNVTELKTAINRIGQNHVRTAAMAFAISQVRRSADLQPIKHELEKLWNEATTVSAMCHALAERLPEVNSDEALLMGLIHNVGKIFILARIHKHDELFSNHEEVHAIVRDWHANVGKAIIENWCITQSIADAVGEHEAVDRQAGYADLTDVLTVAVLAASFIGHEEVDIELNMQGVRAFSRMGLDNERFLQVMSDCNAEIVAMRAALGE